MFSKTFNTFWKISPEFRLDLVIKEEPIRDGSYIMLLTRSETNRIQVRKMCYNEFKVHEKVSILEMFYLRKNCHARKTIFHARKIFRLETEASYSKFSYSKNFPCSKICSCSKNVFIARKNNCILEKIFILKLDILKTL